MRACKSQACLFKLKLCAVAAATWPRGHWPPAAADPCLLSLSPTRQPCLIALALSSTDLYEEEVSGCTPGALARKRPFGPCRGSNSVCIAAQGWGGHQRYRRLVKRSGGKNS